MSANITALIVKMNLGAEEDASAPNKGEIAPYSYRRLLTDTMTRSAPAVANDT